MKSWYKDGGNVVNGQYSKNGEADLQGGYPVGSTLLYLAVEVKTALDYDRVRRAIKEVKGRFEIVDSAKLKKHEPLQVAKINLVRDRGGLALFAHSYAQVVEYVKENT